MTYAMSYFGAVLIAMALVPIISQWAKKHHVVDAPGPRKVHQIPIPRIGGIAFAVPMLILVLPLCLMDNDIGRSLRGEKTEVIVLLIASSFVFAVGLIDDLRPVAGRVKLLCLILASLAVCASGATLRSLGVGTWEVETGWAAWPLTVFWITTITVCLNLMDGLDGLAAGIAAIVCGMIALLAFLTDQGAMVVLMLVLLGGVTGFLFFNFYPAKIFMGDCGSMFLGFVIGAGSVICQTKKPTLVGLGIPFLVMGVPVLDTGFAMIRRRVFERRSLFAPDRNHLHHHLMDLGLHQRTVVIIIYAVTAISASIGVFMLTVGDGWSVALLIVGLVLLISMFASLHGRQYCKMLVAFRHNRAIARERHVAEYHFEIAELMMRDAKSFQAWWNTLCGMSQEMQFMSIGLWKRHSGRCIRACMWNAPEGKFPSGRSAELSLPLQASGAAEWEIRARIWTSGCLEIGGQRAALLARIMDEFPPPEREDEESEPFVDDDRIRQSAFGEMGTLTVSRPRISEDLTCMPSPLSVTGVPVVPFETYDQALECVEKVVESNQQAFWVPVNPVKIYHAWYIPELLSILQHSDACLCDGVGVSIASRILNGRGITRITGCDLFFKLLPMASRKRWGVYLLGATPESNAAARSAIQKMYPDLRIVGSQDGYFKDSQEVIEKINESGADLLFVGMGSPKQEYWISGHRHAINARFCMGVGGSLDVAAGSVRRAPRIFRATGTEFLFRLAMEPRKRLSNQGILLSFLVQVIGRRLSDSGASIRGAYNNR